MKFRKKPVVIDAVQWDGTNVSDVREFFGSFMSWRFNRNDEPTGCIYIVTLEGVHRADSGDWIIKGTKGEFYPCKPDIFITIYEPSEPPADAKERG